MAMLSLLSCHFHFLHVTFQKAVDLFWAAENYMIRGWDLRCLTHIDHLRHSCCRQSCSSTLQRQWMFARREALPKACLLHVEEEPLVHYLTNLSPSMSIIVIEESVRMRKSTSSGSLCSYQTSGNIYLRTLPTVEKLKEKRTTSTFLVQPNLPLLAVAHLWPLNLC